jgi:hypothetical protein
VVIVVVSEADEIVEGIEVDMVVGTATEVVEVVAAMAAMNMVEVATVAVSRVTEEAPPMATKAMVGKEEAIMLQAVTVMDPEHPTQPPPQLLLLPSNSRQELPNNRPIRSKPSVSMKHGAPTTLKTLSSIRTQHTVATQLQWHNINSKRPPPLLLLLPGVKPVLRPLLLPRRRTPPMATCRVKLAHQ